MYYTQVVFNACSLSSEHNEEEETEDDQQKLIKDEQLSTKQKEASQLVQEEKTETGSVCGKKFRNTVVLKAFNILSSSRLKHNKVMTPSQ